METTHYKNKKNGLELVLSYDYYTDNPFDLYEPFGNYYTWEERYHSPMKNDFDNIEEFFDSICGEGKFQALKEKFDHWKDLTDALLEELEKHDIIADMITHHEHGATCYYLGAWNGWDYSICGFVWVTKEEIRKEYNTKKVTKKVKQKAFDLLQAQLRDYNSYAIGNVYRVDIYDENGEIVDCHSGFYGEVEPEHFLPYDWKLEDCEVFTTT